MIWILPDGFAPESHAIPADRRGDLGMFILKKGIAIEGRASDAQGRPLAGMFVRIERDRERSPDREVLESLAASDLVARHTETDAGGRFAFHPLPPGVYVLQPVESQNVPGKGWVRRPLPGVFKPQTVTLREGERPAPIEIRPSLEVVIEGGWVDSKGKPRAGSWILIIGHVGEQNWHTMVTPAADGKFSTRVPRGMDDFQITIFPGSFQSTRYRVGPGEPLKAGQYIMLGTLDHDIKGLELIRYDTTGVIVKATAKDDRVLEDVELAGEYTSERAMAGAGFALKNGADTEIDFDRQADGRFRSDELVPGREVKITAYADGFKPASRTLKLAEGRIEEFTLVLEPK